MMKVYKVSKTGHLLKVRGNIWFCKNKKWDNPQYPSSSLHLIPSLSRYIGAHPWYLNTQQLNTHGIINFTMCIVVFFYLFSICWHKGWNSPSKDGRNSYQFSNHQFYFHLLDKLFSDIISLSSLKQQRQCSFTPPGVGNKEMTRLILVGVGGSSCIDVCSSRSHNINKE